MLYWFGIVSGPLPQVMPSTQDPSPPLLQAVCCADHQHCCPHDYSCNMQSKTCEKNIQGVPESVPLSRVELPSQPRQVPCDPAGHFHCSEWETCCRVADSEWACCPSPKVPLHLDLLTEPLLPRSCYRKVVLCYLEWAAKGTVSQSLTHTLSFWILYSSLKFCRVFFSWVSATKYKALINRAQIAPVTMTTVVEGDLGLLLLEQEECTHAVLIVRGWNHCLSSLDKKGWRADTQIVTSSCRISITQNPLCGSDPKVLVLFWQTERLPY